MLVYKAMYKFLDNGVHAEVLDFRVLSVGGPSWTKRVSCCRVLW